MGFVIILIKIFLFCPKIILNSNIMQQKKVESKKNGL